MTGRLVPHRPPEVVVVGAGSFGSVLAWRLSGGPDGLRTLVLDAGPPGATAHVQNDPEVRETVPPPRLLPPGSTPAASAGTHWAVPWRSSQPYAGLSYGAGGRSRYWGAYCVWPQLGPDGVGDRWPAGSALDLELRHLPAAARLLGLTRHVPHFDGPLNRLLRDRLADALTAGDLPGLTPLTALPAAPTGGDDGDGSARRLHMPVAIGTTGDPDAPRLVRFSAGDLLARRLREADPRLELRQDTHVVRLHARAGRIEALETSRGTLAVPEGTPVVLAVGTIENARLVLDAAGLPAERPAHRLTTHLRSNLTVRVPFPPGPLQPPWGAAALHVRGALRHPGGTETRFHHQVTAYGVGAVPRETARRLYADTPRCDVEALDHTLRVPPRHLVVTVASVAQMHPDGHGEVRLLAERDAHGARRACVRLAPAPADLRTWDALDRSAGEVARTLVGDGPCEVLDGEHFAPTTGRRLTRPSRGPERREPLGCGHHEMGTLEMGKDPETSHTDPDGRLHGTDNLYVAGPAVFPALDSAGPVLPGTATTLRLAEHLRHTAREGHGPPDRRTRRSTR
jgi:hypothetical protein